MQQRVNLLKTEISHALHKKNKKGHSCNILEKSESLKKVLQTDLIIFQKRTFMGTQTH